MWDFFFFSHPNLLIFQKHTGNEFPFCEKKKKHQHHAGGNKTRLQAHVALWFVALVFRLEREQKLNSALGQCEEGLEITGAGTC